MFAEKQINEILELCEKLPKGPWEWVEDKFYGGYSGLVDAENKEVLFPNCCNDGDEGAAWFEDYATPEVRHFITLARTALPQLADEYRKLLAVAEAAKEVLQKEPTIICPRCDGSAGVERCVCEPWELLRQTVVEFKRVEGGK